MTFLSSDQFQETIVSLNHFKFISIYIFEGIPHLFDGDFDSWVEWKSTLGEMIDVDPRNIVLTGSAALGFSLNPGKNFRCFRNSSDIDCGIVSEYHFDIAWRYLRRRRTEWLSLPSKIKNAIEDHRRNLVFSGSIATDRMLSLLSFGDEWQSGLSHMSKVHPTIGRQVKLRIYKDFDALREYQTIGLRETKAKLLEISENDGLSEIPVEDN